MDTERLLEIPNAPLAFLAGVAQDQQAIWTSPFHAAARDLAKWIALGSAIAALIPVDRRIESVVPKDREEIHISKVASRAGTVYAMLPAVAVLTWIGHVTRRQRLEDRGKIGISGDDRSRAARAT